MEAGHVNSHCMIAGGRVRVYEQFSDWTMSFAVPQLESPYSRKFDKTELGTTCTIVSSCSSCRIAGECPFTMPLSREPIRLAQVGCGRKLQDLPAAPLSPCNHSQKICFAILNLRFNSSGQHVASALLSHAIACTDSTFPIPRLPSLG